MCRVHVLARPPMTNTSVSVGRKPEKFSLTRDPLVWGWDTCFAFVFMCACACICVFVCVRVRAFCLAVLRCAVNLVVSWTKCCCCHCPLGCSVPNLPRNRMPTRAASYVYVVPRQGRKGFMLIGLSLRLHCCCPLQQYNKVLQCRSSRTTTNLVEGCSFRHTAVP